MVNANKFFIQAGGIFIAYFYFGILQEKVTKGTYTYEDRNEENQVIVVTEKYTYSLSLVFALCLINYILAAIVLKLRAHEDDKTTSIHYISVAITYLLAMISSNMALQWVSYPTQVVGKAAKPIPVMLLGVLLGRKSYPFKKYVFVFLIVIGIVLFMFKDKGKGSQEAFNFGLGELLLLSSLTMDGLVGAVQERIRASSKPSGYQMMKATNAWSIIFLLAALILTGELFQFLDFAQRHPQVISNLFVLAVTQAVGQLFLYNMVSDFGPLMVSVVTTSRKFFTVLGSVIIFGNALAVRQWIGAILVFTGLFLDAFFSKSGPKKPNKS